MEDLATPPKNINQPVKESFFLTPTAANICILCHEDITIKFPKDFDGSKKRKLWDGDNRKSKICTELEAYLGIEVSRTTDFHSICLPCSNKVRSALKNQQEKSSSLQKGRALAAEQFLRSRSYLRKSDELANEYEPPIKKQLLYDGAANKATVDYIRLWNKA